MTFLRVAGEVGVSEGRDDVATTGLCVTPLLYVHTICPLPARVPVSLNANLQERDWLWAAEEKLE